MVYKKNLQTVLIIISTFAAGYLMGTAMGTGMARSYVMNRVNFFSLLYRPAEEYRFVMEKLSSENELNRLTGYYSLLENKNIDLEFLSGRYKKENSVYIKRTIIWILGFSKDRPALLAFFSKIYKDSNEEIKIEILRSIKRSDEQAFKKFIQEHKVEKKLLRDF